jgi:hypothetical protein
MGALIRGTGEGINHKLPPLPPPKKNSHGDLWYRERRLSRQTGLEWTAQLHSDMHTFTHFLTLEHGQT